MLTRPSRLSQDGQLTALNVFRAEKMKSNVLSAENHRFERAALDLKSKGNRSFDVQEFGRALSKLTLPDRVQVRIEETGKFALTISTSLLKELGIQPALF